MKEEIALYVNNHGEITGFTEGGFIRIFYNNKNKWNIKKEVSFDFSIAYEKENIGLYTRKISEVLEECKIFVAKEIPDLIYMILKNLEVSTWKLEGEQYKILEYVMEKEKEEAEEIKVINDLEFINQEERFFPKEIGSSGYYTLNLKELQEQNIGITTKQVLMPFFIDNSFNELIVICSHIPCWFEAELKRANFNFEASKTGENDYIVIINHNN